MNAKASARVEDDKSSKKMLAKKKSNQGPNECIDSTFTRAQKILD